jgi:hypothetical protein
MDNLVAWRSSRRAGCCTICRAVGRKRTAFTRTHPVVGGRCDRRSNHCRRRNRIRPADRADPLPRAPSLPRPGSIVMGGAAARPARNSDRRHCSRLLCGVGDVGGRRALCAKRPQRFVPSARHVLHQHFGTEPDLERRRPAAPALRGEAAPHAGRIGDTRSSIERYC